MNDLRKVDIDEIAKKGQKIYSKIKGQYKSSRAEKYLAINVSNKEVFEAGSTAEAVERAKKKYPNEIFYVVRVGHSAVEIMQNLKMERL